jgi:hypothetical protein
MSEYPEWLSEAGRAVFDATLPGLRDTSPEMLEILAAYADAVVNLRKVRNDPAKAQVWRKAMLYARNGLGFGGRVFVDLVGLLCDSGWPGEPDPTAHLKPSWQLPETERPEDYMTND